MRYIELFAEDINKDKLKVPRFWLGPNGQVLNLDEPWIGHHKAVINNPSLFGVNLSDCLSHDYYDIDKIIESAESNGWIRITTDWPKNGLKNSRFLGNVLISTKDAAHARKGLLWLNQNGYPCFSAIIEIGPEARRVTYYLAGEEFEDFLSKGRLRKTISESAFGGDTYWFNPRTKQIIDAPDHGEAVEKHWAEFGIDKSIVMRITHAFEEASELSPYDSEYHSENRFDNISVLIPFICENDPLQWNDVWERLGMEAGWVRVGVPSMVYGGYLSASSAALIWHAVRYLSDNLPFPVSDLSLEIVTPKLSKFYKINNAEKIHRFIKNGPKNALVTLQNLRNQ